MASARSVWVGFDHPPHLLARSEFWVAHLPISVQIKIIRWLATACLINTLRLSFRSVAMVGLVNWLLYYEWSCNHFREIFYEVRNVRIKGSGLSLLFLSQVCNKGLGLRSPERPLISVWVQWIDRSVLWTFSSDQEGFTMSFSVFFVCLKLLDRSASSTIPTSYTRLSQ